MMMTGSNPQPNSIGGQLSSKSLAVEAFTRRWSDEEKVLRALLAQMPLVQELARVGQMDLEEAADGMVNLIELGLYKLVVHPDGRYELTAVDKHGLMYQSPPTPACQALAA
jgi:hypothetical protein